MANGTNPELQQIRHLTLGKGYILLVVALLVALAARYMSRGHLSLTPSALLAMGSAILTILVVYYFSHRLTIRRTRCYIGPALLFIGISYGGRRFSSARSNPTSGWMWWPRGSESCQRFGWSKRRSDWDYFPQETSPPPKL